MRIVKSTDESGQRWVTVTGKHGDGEGELKIKADVVVDFAMALLGLDGDEVKVTIKPPRGQKKAKARS